MAAIAEAQDDARRDSRSEILKAAAEAFMTNGYAATSIDTVAEVLGCTKGRIYYQYKSKADLFFDVHREAMRMNIETIEPIAAGEGSPVERITRMLEAHVRLIMTELPFQRVSMQGVEMHVVGSTTPRQRQILRKLIDMRDHYERLFVAVIEEGIASGDFRPVEARMVVKPLLGGLNWMTVWYRPKPRENEEARRQLARQMTEFLLNGLVRRA
jgi:AcrR family transcriptional regulator